MLTADEADALTGLIYDAALDEQFWVPVMNRMADAVGGGATALIRKNLTTGRGRGVFGRITEAQFTDYFGRFARANPLAEAIAPLPAGSFLIDWQVMPKPDLVRSEYYNDFLLRRDIHGVLGLMVWRHGDETAIINLTRPPATGEYEPVHADLLAPFMPHLMRAVGIAKRLPALHGQTRALDAALAAWHAAVLVLDDGGRILYANPAAERILAAQDGLCVSRGMLATADAAAGRELAGQIARATHGEPPSGNGVAVPRLSGRRPYWVELVPCRPGRFDLFHVPARVVVNIVSLDTESGPTVDTLRKLFGLTPAQASVAALLGRGRDLRDVATALGISFYTARRHLADIMARTETHTQPALVHLLSGLTQTGEPRHETATRH